MKTAQFAYSRKLLSGKKCNIQIPCNQNSYPVSEKSILVILWVGQRWKLTNIYLCGSDNNNFKRLVFFFSVLLQCDHFFVWLSLGMGSGKLWEYRLCPLESKEIMPFRDWLVLSEHDTLSKFSRLHFLQKVKRVNIRQAKFGSSIQVQRAERGIWSPDPGAPASANFPYPDPTLCSYPWW